MQCVTHTAFNAEIFSEFRKIWKLHIEWQIYVNPKFPEKGNFGKRTVTLRARHIYFQSDFYARNQLRHWLGQELCWHHTKSTIRTNTIWSLLPMTGEHHIRQGIRLHFRWRTWWMADISTRDMITRHCYCNSLFGSPSHSSNFWQTILEPLGSSVGHHAVLSTSVLTSYSCMSLQALHPRSYILSWSSKMSGICQCRVEFVCHGETPCLV